MQLSSGTCLFELTTQSESKCYAELKDYFDHMYFAN